MQNAKRANQNNKKITKAAYNTKGAKIGFDRSRVTNSRQKKSIYDQQCPVKVISCRCLIQPKA